MRYLCVGIGVIISLINVHNSYRLLDINNKLRVLLDNPLIKEQESNESNQSNESNEYNESNESN